MELWVLGDRLGLSAGDQVGVKGSWVLGCQAIEFYHYYVNLKDETNRRYLAKTRSSYYSKRFGFPTEKT